MFQKPENIRVAERDIDLFTAKAIVKGSKVPRSPKDPEISERGAALKVETLFAWKRRICAKVMILLVKIMQGIHQADSFCQCTAEATGRSIERFSVFEVVATRLFLRMDWGLGWM